MAHSFKECQAFNFACFTHQSFLSTLSSSVKFIQESKESSQSEMACICDCLQCNCVFYTLIKRTWDDLLNNRAKQKHTPSDFKLTVTIRSYDCLCRANVESSSVTCHISQPAYYRITIAHSYKWIYKATHSSWNIRKSHFSHFGIECRSIQNRSKVNRNFITCERCICMLHLDSLKGFVCMCVCWLKKNGLSTGEGGRNWGCRLWISLTESMQWIKMGFDWR